LLLHKEISDALVRKMIRQNQISLGGNGPKKIYGYLNCASGKRLKKQHRVFFKNEKEAILAGFRPCGICMKTAYKNYIKNGFV